MATCPDCGAEVAEGLLVCPACHRLMHSQRLKQLAADATAAQNAGDISAAIRLWRESLDLLPPESQQFQAITPIVADLSRRIDQGEAPQASSGGQLKKSAGLAGVVVFLLTKGKLLLMGMANLPTLLTMLASLSLYWSIWGWKFAVGLVLCIYVHEMGHVAALRQYGFKATAPMFIPGLGALIRLQQRVADAREDARIGLAGPIYGLAASVACAGVFYFTQYPAWGAIAKINAWINLFNLTPLFSLDGGRGLRALSAVQAIVVVAVGAGMWYLTKEGMLGLVTIVAGFVTLTKQKSPGDVRAMIEFVLLIIFLSLLSKLPVDIHS